MNCACWNSQLSASNLYQISASRSPANSLPVSHANVWMGFNSENVVASFGLAHTLPKLIVLFCGLFVCKCVLYCCNGVSTQLQLTNISIYIACRQHSRHCVRGWVRSRASLVGVARRKITATPGIELQCFNENLFILLSCSGNISHWQMFFE